MSSEYAVELFGPMGTKQGWSDAHPTLGDARRAGKQWLKDKGYGYDAVLLKSTPNPGHKFGTYWKEVGRLSWAS